MIIDFNGKTVVITGAGGFLGRSMAEEFAKSGAEVAVCDINMGEAEKTVETIADLGGGAHAFEFDVSDREKTAAAMKKINERFGKIDILINNAGINVPSEKRRNIDEFDDVWWDNIINVDLCGIYNCSKAALPFMKGEKGANIINISSIVGIVPLKKQCAFAAAKAGVINLTKAMAAELENIRVNAVAPGSIATAGT